MDIEQHNTVIDGDISDKTGLGTNEQKNTQCTRKVCHLVRSSASVCACILILFVITKTNFMAHSQVAKGEDGFLIWNDGM
jgi:hypothetical protein